MDQDVTHPAGSICHPSIRLHKRSEAGEGNVTPGLTPIIHRPSRIG